LIRKEELKGRATRPGETSITLAGSADTRSPGRIVGAMQVPETRKHTHPNVPATSAARSHPNVFAVSMGFGLEETEP